jgi:hypothetical protein
MKITGQRSRTALSHLSRSTTASGGHLCGMARRSHGSGSSVLVSALLSLASLSGTGCIVADPPDYGPAQRSPIFMYNPSPNPYSLQVLSRTSTGSPPVAPTVRFGATVRSEDAGEQLVALCYFDYKHANSAYIFPKVLPPLTLEDERQIAFDITPNRDLEPGCHTVTIMVMHYSSWNQDAATFQGPPDDLAQETWFVSVDDGPDGTFKVKDCPLSTAEQ